MSGQTEISQKNHHRAVRFFWGFLIAATVVSLIGNITHAVLSYIPQVVVQIGAAAVPPITLLAAVHGMGLAVRAGASGTVYRWSVSAVAAIGIGAFTVSFLALRDLMQAIGYSAATGWVFPAIIDTAVAVSTLMLVALGDKPPRRSRSVITSANTQTPATRGLAQSLTRSAKTQAKSAAPGGRGVPASTSAQPDPAHTAQGSVPAETTQVDADLALQLISSGVTTQPVETVNAVLAASRDGASINAAAKVAGINYRTAQRIVKAAADHQQGQLVAVS